MTHELAVAPILAGQDFVAATFSGVAHGVVTTSANVSLDTSMSPWLSVSVPLAMRYGAIIRMQGAVDPVALTNSSKAQAILAGWYRDLSEVPVIAETSPAATNLTQRGVGCFFSGGVDSFYSAIKNLNRLTHLIFVRGFDIPADDDDLGGRAAEAARAAAAALGLPLIEVISDIRQLSDPHSHWGSHFHGAALASVALMLSDHVQEVIIPASYHEDDLHPWGSHPALDPLWSSSAVTFTHHGTNVTRPQKVAFISEHQVAMDHLRVCWLNPDGEYNCGRCEKCIRTVINLRVAGASGRCRTLPADVELHYLRKLRIDGGGRAFAAENLNELKRLGTRDVELEKALVGAVRRGLAQDAAIRAKATVKRALLR